MKYPGAHTAHKVPLLEVVHPALQAQREPVEGDVDVITELNGVVEGCVEEAHNPLTQLQPVKVNGSLVLFGTSVGTRVEYHLPELPADVLPLERHRPVPVIPSSKIEHSIDEVQGRQDLPKWLGRHRSIAYDCHE